MTAKIEWYREVLELEPNSKVFFPLARLLAEDGQAEEAVTLLEKGLDRHPEFLEARLFLIELLHKHNRREKCNEQVARLSKMFASYAGFWQAWAACLASEQGEEDTASIIRFLAAHFISGPLNLHEVLNRGLDSILGKHQATQVWNISVKEQNNATARQMTATAEFAANSDEMLKDLDAELGAAQIDQSVPDVEPKPDAEFEPATEPAAAIAESGVESDSVDVAATGKLPDEEKRGEAEPAMETQSVPVSEQEPVFPEAELGETEQTIGDIDSAADMLPAEEPLAETEFIEPDLAEVHTASAESEGTSAETKIEIEPAEIPAPETAITQKSAQALTMQPEVMGEPESGTKIELPEPELAVGDIDPDAGMLPAEEQAPEPELSVGTPDPVAEILLAQDDEATTERASGTADSANAPLPAEEETDVPASEPAARLDLGAFHPSAYMADDVRKSPGVTHENVQETGSVMDDATTAAEMQTSAESTPVAAQESVALVKTAAEKAMQSEADMLAAMDLPEMARGNKNANNIDEDFTEEEPFSLRTRSMAEVLAEQGDIQGALDIYQELAAAATSADEAEDINHRIATLQGRLKVANASAAFKKVEEEEAAARSKAKLLGMLEALEEGMRARAQG